MTPTAALVSVMEQPVATLLAMLARASSPAERITGGWLRPSGSPAVAQERLARWSQRIADGRPERVAEVLAEHGLTLDQWRIGLRDATAVPGEPLPRWAEDAMTLLGMVGTESDPPSPPTLREVAGAGLPAWVDQEQPWRFHAGFQDWMAAARRDVDRWTAATPLSEEAQRDLVIDLARRQLVVSGPLLMEAAAARPWHDPLFATDAKGEWQTLWSTHPVVARLLATVWRQWRETTAELCSRITADLPAVCPGLGVIRIDLSVGDQHCGGRAVVRLRLSDGTSVFLKPRSDRLQGVLSAVLAQVDAAGTPLGLRLPAIVERDGYAWSHEVLSGDCPDDGAVDAYFRRAGALLRVAQAMGSTDLHHENFVPTPDLPVLVDLETVVAPGQLRTAPEVDAVSARLSDTPGPTSMVTSVVSGRPGRGTADLGALAGPSEVLTPYAMHALVQGNNGPELRSTRVPLSNGAALPTRGGRPISVRGHEQALIDGYAEVQRRLASLVDADYLPAADPEPEVRLVVRPTRIYARLLLQSTAAAALVDGTERELVLDRLYRATGTAPDGLIACEVDAMRELDVPLFTVPFTTTDVVGDRGRVLANVLTESADTRTRNRLRAAGARADHVDDLSATLFAMDSDEPAFTASHTVDRVAGQVDPYETVTVLLDRAIELADGTLAWIGLEHDPNRNRWTFGRMGAGLTGQAGIGLALATVAARGADAPAGCAAAARAALLGSIDRAGSGDQGPADAFSGPAGVLYATAVAASLLNDPVLLDAAQSLLVPCLRAARRDEPSVVIDGAAGAILALLHLPEEAAVADALTELGDLRCTPSDVEAPDSWSFSLPSRAFGTALARHRLALHRREKAEPELPPPAGPGDATAAATVRPPARPDEPVSVDAPLRLLLDDVALTQAAVQSGADGRWAARRDRLVDVIVTRRARTGRWCAPLLAPDSTFLSAVHGMAALSTLCTDLGSDLPIARTFT